MGRPQNPPRFQRIKHGKDEVVNRIQDNVQKAVDSVSETLEDYPTTTESDAAIASAVAAALASIPPQHAALLAVTAIISGTSRAVVANCNRAVALLFGGGGGGGGVGASAGSPQVNVGGGGASGGMAMFTTSTIPASWSYSIAAGGTAGTSGGGTGGTGGNTVFTDGATICTSYGGLGGVGDASAATTPSLTAGGMPSASSTNAIIIAQGQPGGDGIHLQGTSSNRSGHGGGTIFGMGGPGLLVNGAGNPGVIYGTGGSGALAMNGGAAQQGGAGASGLIILLEFG